MCRDFVHAGRYAPGTHAPLRVPRLKPSEAVKLPRDLESKHHFGLVCIPQHQREETGNAENPQQLQQLETSSRVEIEIVYG